MEKMPEIDYGSELERLQKDLDDIKKREDIELAKPRSRSKAEDRKEIWEARETILKQIHGLKALRNDEEGLKRDTDLLNESDRISKNPFR